MDAEILTRQIHNKKSLKKRKIVISFQESPVYNSPFSFISYKYVDFLTTYL